MPTKRAALFRLVAKDLRALGQLPLSDKEDELRWNEEVGKFRAKLSTIYKDVAAELPHELEHYMCDADIRLKDAAYRARQDLFVNKLLRSLEETR